VTWSDPEHVRVAASKDGGKSFGRPVLVNRTPMRIDTGPDARPQLVFDRSGAAIVAFTVRKDVHYNGQVFVARSNAARTSFTPPAPVSAHSASQRFVTLTLAPDGRLFAAWIDKRREGPAAGLPEREGASIAFAWSDDGGASFQSATLAHAGMCECCRLGVAMTSDSRPIVLFRDVVGGVRDHAVVTFTAPMTPGPVRPLAADRWELTGCPHHGPAISVAADGAYHVVWFTDGAARKGAFYAQSHDEGRTWSAPMSLSPGGMAQRPHIASAGAELWLAWKEQRGGATKAFVRHSSDGGRIWSAPREVTATTGMSDHPLLLTRDGRAYLSWLTRAHGYQLVALTSGP
jgi:hypothetical protein